MISAYYELSKPGIIYGNLLVALAAYIYASHWHVDAVVLTATLVGLACVIASGAACNNVIDRPIDARMERTKNRALIRGALTPTQALVYAAAAGVVGALLLYIYVNPLTLGVAALGWVVYVCMYSPLKHHSSLAVFVGAVSGATPPVIGYTAATGVVDSAAFLLFAFLFIWQIPHFLAIAVFRYDEYAAAGVKLLVPRLKHQWQKTTARVVFYSSLVVLLGWCVVLMLQR